VSPLGGAVWCMVFALVILAVLMLDEHITRRERNQRR
jgi:hypothetical protein